MPNNFTFNQVRKNYLTVLKTHRPIWAPRQRNIIRVPNRAGGYLSSSIIEELRITVEALIDAEDTRDLRRKMEDIAGWLNVDEPKTLIFDDDNLYYYRAVAEGDFDVDEIVNFARVTITFVCPDPHKYWMISRKETFDDTIEVLENEGNTSTYPLFRIRVLEDITFVDLVTELAYMRIGTPTTWEEEIVPEEVMLLNDPMNSVTPWVTASTVDNGYITGEIRSDGNAFYPYLFGGELRPHQWQGPSLKRALDEPVQDFRAEIRVEALNSRGKMGMIEVYLLDNSNNTVAKVGIEDIWKNVEKNQVKFQLGNLNNRKEFYGEYEPDTKKWNNFDGRLRVARYGRQYNAYFALVDSNGDYQYGKLFTYYDSRDEYQAPITQIQVAFRKWPLVEENTLRINQIYVTKINEPEPYEIPTIARAGDLITIDHRSNEIRVNGELRPELKDFGSTFFPLLQGDNIIQAEPFESIEVEAEWRPRYL